MTRHDEFGDYLAPDDQRLVDLLVDAGFERRAAKALAPSQQERAERLLSLFELLNDYPVEDGDDTLVHATLARIDRYKDQRAARMTFDSAAEANEGRSRRIRLPDFISVAAVILIGFSVIWPVSSHLRQRSIDLGCANNLRLMGLGFGNYANDYNGTMPVAMANLGSDVSWYNFRNAAVNLNPLVKGGYCELGHLSCPGHADLAGESYSYQWMMPGVRPTWGVQRVTVVLGDRNPVIDAALSNGSIPALSTSINHGGRGQNTLSSDGGVLWLRDPVVGSNNDYIWLPKGVVILRIGDRPTDPADVFLAH